MCSGWGKSLSPLAEILSQGSPAGVDSDSVNKPGIVREAEGSV